MKRFGLFCLAILVLASCTPQPEAKTLPEGWRLSYSRSGGFAGLIHEVTVTEGGEVTIMDHGEIVDVNQLDASDIAALEALLLERAAIEVIINAVHLDPTTKIDPVITREHPKIGLRRKQSHIVDGLDHVWDEP